MPGELSGGLVPAGDLVLEIVKENLYEEILVIPRANPHADVLVRGRILRFGNRCSFRTGLLFSQLVLQPQRTYLLRGLLPPRLTADPLSQLLYYVAPPLGQYQSYQRQETNRERRVRERRELKERERQERRDRNRQGY